MANLRALWHTEGRRQPSVLGKDPSGKRIPGGPYTSYQAAASTVVGLLLFFTRPAWGPLLGDSLIFEMGAIIGGSFFALKAASRFDYTNVAIMWQAYAGIKAVLASMHNNLPIMTSTGRPLDLAPELQLAACDRVLCFVERGSVPEPTTEDVSVQAPEQIVDELAAPSRKRPLIEDLLVRVNSDTIPAPAAGQPQATTKRSGQFVSVGRRLPRIPVRSTPAPQEHVLLPRTDERQLVGAGRSPQPPSSALESFLAAGRTTGEPR